MTDDAEDWTPPDPIAVLDEALAEPGMTYEEAQGRFTAAFLAQCVASEMRRVNGSGPTRREGR